ncbi:hypothetical protein ANO11243_075990 [Dothideomycetidae sp. 11243]|nr:hypothetical protein ANO11243_075990 [fungal sp. No.11243]
MSSELDPKPYACTTCTQRKVKCDKTVPCGSCTRSRLQCNYRPANQGQKRKRKSEAGSEALLEMVRSHEALLRRSGIAFESVDEVDDGHNETAPSPNVAPESPAPTRQPRIPPSRRPADQQNGILIREHGGRRYYDYGLIGTLGQQFTQDTTHIVSQYGLGDNTPSASHESPQDIPIVASLATGLSSVSSSALYARIRRPGICSRLWPVFLDNVHPLTKAVHGPTVAQLMRSNEDTLSTPSNALRLATCACALSSMSEKDCQSIIGESQASMLFAFQSVTRSALLEASFLRIPDMDLLTAHVLLLTSMLHTSDSSSLWIMMGATVRMAQMQGLHRDGVGLGLDPFEVEMRRRLWWYIVTLDIRMTELMGLETALPRKMDTPLPANVNDADLQPDMDTLPSDRTGATEMTFCLFKYEISRHMLNNDARFGAARPNGLQPAKQSLTDLEATLEEKFLKFCQPVVPVQFLTTIMARSLVCKLNQLAQHRRSRHHTDDAEQMTSAQLNTTLSLATKSVQYDNLIHCNRSLAGYRWHVHFYFPWGAPIFILKILASRPDWDTEMQGAWRQIEELHEHHPEYSEADTVVHRIVNDLTLKAWTGREAWLKSRGTNQGQPPDIIATLMRQHGQLTAMPNPPPQPLYQQNYNMQPETPYQTDQAQLNTDLADFAILQGNDLDFLDSALLGADWAGWSGY